MVNIFVSYVVLFQKNILVANIVFDSFYVSGIYAKNLVLLATTS